MLALGQTQTYTPPKRRQEHSRRCQTMPRTTKNLTFSEFEKIYKDHKCPLCPHYSFSKADYYKHKDPTKSTACYRVGKLIPYLKGIKKGLLEGKALSELRGKGYTHVIVVNPVEDDDHGGKK